MISAGFCVEEMGSESQLNQRPHPQRSLEQLASCFFLRINL